MVEILRFHLSCDKELFNYVNNVEISDDGSFILDDSYMPDMLRFWDCRLGLIPLSISGEKEKRVIAYNMTMLMIYALRCNPKMYAFDYDMLTILLPVICRIPQLEKLDNPSLLWSYTIDYIGDIYDYVQGLRKTIGIDCEAQIVSMIANDIEKILLKKEE